MVSGGSIDYHNVTTSVELLNLDGTWICSLNPLLQGRKGHSQNGFISCGGCGHCKRKSSGKGGDECTQTSCETLVNGEWQQTHTMSKARCRPSSWSSPLGVMLIGGSSGTYKSMFLCAKAHQ